MPFKIRAALLVAAVAAAAALTLGAQVDTGKPIRLKSPKPRVMSFKGEVLYANTVQIAVRSREDTRVVKTFTYTPKVKEKMEKLIERGGYQPGDRVVIRHQAGSDVALKIQGKPSKPH